MVNLTSTLAPGGVTVNNSALNYTFTGPGKLTGPTGLTKNGTGILPVLTANDFTGDTIVNVGTLQLGNGGTSGSVTSNLVCDDGTIGTLIWYRTGAVTYAGTISGTGNVIQAGSGTLTFTIAGSDTACASFCALFGSRSRRSGSVSTANGTRFDCSGPLRTERGYTPGCDSAPIVSRGAGRFQPRSSTVVLASADPPSGKTLVMYGNSPMLTR
jgi:autotransporter-associated beta strand protein